MSDEIKRAQYDIEERARSGMHDPLTRYEAMTSEQQEAERLVGRLTDLRARALAELHVDGWSYAKIAQSTGLSRARVQQLVERGRDVKP